MICDHYVIYENLPCSVRSFIRANDDGSYTIVINSRIGSQEQVKAYQHELRHLAGGDLDKDLPVDLIERNNHKEG